MKKIFNKIIILGAFMYCSTATMPIFSCNKTEIPALSSKTELLSELDHLPITNETLQRTYLVRHGESTANVYFEIDGKNFRYVSGHSADITLTADGEKQITKLAEKLSKCFPKEAPLVITCSSAVRTQRTARILFEELSKTHFNLILIDESYPELNERSLGHWEGKLKDEHYDKAEETWRKMSAAEKFISPEVAGGESYHEVANRALSAIAELYGRFSESTVIAVTSFNTINASAIKLNNIDTYLSTKPGTKLPKLDLGNGDLVLLETFKNQFYEPKVVSHIVHESKESRHDKV